MKKVVTVVKEKDGQRWRIKGYDERVPLTQLRTYRYVNWNELAQCMGNKFGVLPTEFTIEEGGIEMAFDHKGAEE